MNVLSLFDGMSCGMIALKRAGIEVNKYYASELDKFAIAESKANWPGIIHLGDVTKWREWDIDWASIDLLIGGSPCQGFSFAGKQLAFDDPRSKLFFVYVDILNHIRSVNPDVKFLLENVKMKKEHMDVITDYLGVEPVFINSALVSAQNRQRWYWANWEFGQPKDKNIVLIDILETEIDLSKWKHSDKAIEYMNRKTRDGRTHWDFKHHSDTKDNKSQCLTANMHKGVPYNILVDRRKSRAVTTTENAGNSPQQYFDKRKKNLIFLVAENWIYWLYRKLTVIECCRLQTVDDDYFKVSSNTQAYKMLGNGWTIDVIAHIFRCANFKRVPPAISLRRMRDRRAIRICA